MTAIREISGRRLLMVTGDDPILRTTQDVFDLIDEGMAHDARMIAVPVSRLAPSFFQLRSGFAGEVLQKLANYRFRLAILGDIAIHTQTSAAFRDFVRESNRGSAVSFVTDFNDLFDRLAAIADA